MAHRTSWPTRPLLAALAFAAFAAGCGDNLVVPGLSISPLNRFHQSNLIADVAGSSATTVDATLVNPWGLAFGSTGVLWVADNGTGLSTTYNADGTKRSTTVTIPGAGLLSAGAPTGTVFNASSDFAIPGAGASLFIFAGEDGTISAWNAAAGSLARVVADRSNFESVYKGLAIASNSGANYLYVTDFKNNGIDVFDRNFAFIRTFKDPSIPAGYAPFGISNIGGQLFVTFAKQKAPDNKDDVAGVGNGYVDVFNVDGTLSRRFASNGPLNSPWGVAIAPASFGAFGGDILIGNFGDGRIGAYDPATGAFIDVIRDMNANPIEIDGLWSLTFGPGAGSSTLYFSAGPGEEAHGLVGTLTAAASTTNAIAADRAGARE